MRPARRAGARDRVRVRGDGGGGGREERRQAPEDSAEKHGSCVRSCELSFLENVDHGRFDPW